MARNFAIFATPRSRSAWLGAFLTYRDWVCWHNPTIGLHGVGDLDKLLHRPMTGICDTSWAVLWPEVIDRDPSLKIVVLERDVDEVIDSLREIGPFDEGQARVILARLRIALGELKQLSGTLTISAASLEDPAVAKRVFEFCLPYKFDPEWYSVISKINIQPDIANLLSMAKANSRGLANTYGLANSYYDSRVRAHA